MKFLAAALFSFSTFTAFAQDSTVIVKPSPRMQCEEPLEIRLSEYASELEGSELKIHAIKEGKINRMACMGCGVCHSGDYVFAEIDGPTEQLPQGWEKLQNDETAIRDSN